MYCLSKIERIRCETYSTSVDEAFAENEVGVREVGESFEKDLCCDARLKVARVELVTEQRQIEIHYSTLFVQVKLEVRTVSAQLSLLRGRIRFLVPASERIAPRSAGSLGCICKTYGD